MRSRIVPVGILFLAFIVSLQSSNVFGSSHCEVRLGMIQTPEDEWLRDTFSLWGENTLLPLPISYNLIKLKALNWRMKRSSFSKQKMIEKGVIVEVDEVPTRTTPSGTQKLKKLREIRLPKASTGMYLPKAQFDPKLHKAIVIYLPGIGSNYSNAMSVADMVITTSDLKFRPELGDVRVGKDKINFGTRVYGVALDLPLNGMATESPDSFSSATGNIAVVRHAMLVLQKMIPGVPIVVAGRSQGGLVAMHFADHFGKKDGLYGAIALNPSPTKLDILKQSVLIHEESAEAVMGGVGIGLMPRPWVAYRIVTPTYYLRNKSQAPTLVLLGKDDPSYPQAEYRRDFIEPWIGNDPANRQEVTFEPPKEFDQEVWNQYFAHNLWARSASVPGKGKVDHPRKSEVISEMASFIDRILN